MVEGYRKRQKTRAVARSKLYGKVSRLFRNADPRRLIPVSAPDDEYDPEISTIVPRLSETRSAAEVRKILHEEFVHWFAADIAGPIWYVRKAL